MPHNDSKLSPRDSVFKEIKRSITDGFDIYIITDDFGSQVLDEIKEEYPHRVINTGAAEQNAILVAKGMALTGKLVFVYGISSFIVRRCYEQIKINLEGTHDRVFILGVGFEDEYHDAGRSHWSHDVSELIKLCGIQYIELHGSDEYISERIRGIIETGFEPAYIQLRRK